MLARYTGLGTAGLLAMMGLDEERATCHCPLTKGH